MNGSYSRRATLRRWLIDPLRPLPPAQVRHARFSASLWLALAIMGGFFVLSPAFFGDGASSGAVMDYLGFVVILAAYLLSRYGHYQIAAALMMVTISLIVAAIAAPNGQLLYPVFLFYLIIPIIISSIFLPIIGTILTSVAVMVEIGLVYALTGAGITPLFNDAPLAFVPVISLLLVATSYHRRQLERDRERAMAWRESQLRKVIDNLPVLVDAVDEEGIVRYWNAECERVTGYKASEIVGRADGASLLYPDKDYLRTLLEPVPPGTAYRNYVTHLTCKDGSIRWVAWSNIAEEIGLEGYADWGVGIDITDQLNRERELAAIAAMSMALRAANTRAEVIRQTLEQISTLLGGLGASLALHRQESGQTFLVVEDARDQWKDRIGLRIPTTDFGYQTVVGQKQALVANSPAELNRLFRADLMGEINAFAAVPLIVGESVIGALGIGREAPFAPEDVRILTAMADIAANAIHRVEGVEQLEQRVAERTAALEQAYQRLKSLDRLKSKLLSDISHELRTPASNLGVYLYLLESDPTSQFSAKRLQVLKDQVMRLNKLIEGVLNILRIELNKAEIELSAVPLGPLVDLTIAPFYARVSAKGLTLNVAIPSDLPPALAHPDYLSQVVTLIVDNAVAYTMQGCITLMAENVPEKGQVRLRCTDTGIGIPAEDMPHLYERFYRGKLAGQSNIPGIGLGLSLVKEILDLMGGTIDISSTPDVGTQVTVCLRVAPLAEGQERTSHPATVL
jgi:PAS domain S-box-containing protein